MNSGSMNRVIDVCHLWNNERGLEQVEVEEIHKELRRAFGRHSKGFVVSAPLTCASRDRPCRRNATTRIVEHTA